MRKFFQSNRIECECTFTIQALENVPYMSGKFYIVAASSSGNFKSTTEDVDQHQVSLNFTSVHSLKFAIPSGTTEMEAQYIKCKVYHVTASKTIKLGRVLINVTEYLSESSTTKRFLLQEAKENITVLCTLNMSTNSYDAVSDLDSSFIASAQQPTPQIFELRTTNLEKLLPCTGPYKTTDEEIDALFDPNIDFKFTVADLQSEG